MYVVRRYDMIQKKERAAIVKIMHTVLFAFAFRKPFASPRSPTMAAAYLLHVWLQT